MKETVPSLTQPTFTSDADMVSYVEKLTVDVAEGRLTTRKAVNDALKPLGANVGPFGCTSHELEVAMAKLSQALRAKKI